MIIEYLIGYCGQDKVRCCGMFTDHSHFIRFVAVEATYGRIVTNPEVIP